MFCCRSLALESRPKESSFMPEETWKDHVDQCLCKGANSTDRLLQGKENKARTINSWIPDFPNAHIWSWEWEWDRVQVQPQFFLCNLVRQSAKNHQRRSSTPWYAWSGGRIWGESGLMIRTTGVSSEVFKNDPSSLRSERSWTGGASSSFSHISSSDSGGWGRSTVPSNSYSSPTALWYSAGPPEFEPPIKGSLLTLFV